jgi:hypothetical protein
MEEQSGLEGRSNILTYSRFGGCLSDAEYGIERSSSGTGSGYRGQSDILELLLNRAL